MWRWRESSVQNPCQAAGAGFDMIVYALQFVRAHPPVPTARLAALSVMAVRSGMEFLQGPEAVNDGFDLVEPGAVRILSIYGWHRKAAPWQHQHFEKPAFRFQFFRFCYLLTPAYPVHQTGIGYNLAQDWPGVVFSGVHPAYVPGWLRQRHTGFGHRWRKRSDCYNKSIHRASLLKVLRSPVPGVSIADAGQSSSMALSRPELWKIDRCVVNKASICHSNRFPCATWISSSRPCVVLTKNGHWSWSLLLHPENRFHKAFLAGIKTTPGGIGPLASYLRKVQGSHQNTLPAPVSPVMMFRLSKEISSSSKDRVIPYLEFIYHRTGKFSKKQGATDIRAAVSGRFYMTKSPLMERA